MLKWFYEIGEAQFTHGNEIMPLTWCEIKAWQDLSGSSLEFWESQLLREMSVAYVAQYNKSQEMSCAPPWYYVEE